MSVAQSIGHHSAGRSRRRQSWLRRGIRWTINLLVFLIRRTLHLLNPLRRSVSARGFRGFLELLLTVPFLWMFSGMMQERLGLRSAVFSGLDIAERGWEQLLETVVRSDQTGVVTTLLFLGRFATVAIAIAILTLWLINLPNYVEAVVLSILSAFTGERMISLVTVILVFSVPVTMTSLFVTTSQSLCVLLLILLFFQLIYLRYGINAELARNFLRRMLVYRAGSAGHMDDAGAGGADADIEDDVDDEMGVDD